MLAEDAEAALGVPGIETVPEVVDGRGGRRNRSGRDGSLRGGVEGGGSGSGDADEV
jgi:hypothetical protein